MLMPRSGIIEGKNFPLTDIKLWENSLLSIGKRLNAMSRSHTEIDAHGSNGLTTRIRLMDQTETFTQLEWESGSFLNFISKNGSWRHDQ